MKMRFYLRKLLRTRTTNSNWIAHARRHNHGCNSYGGHALSYSMTSTNKGENMYIEVTDAIAITIALTTSITLIITTAVRNAKLTRYLQELTATKI